MVPFAGRVGDARYRFDGREYDLQPGAEGAARGIMHGFVRDVDFTIADLVADGSSASATLATSAIRPRSGYPFSIDLAVRFTLGAGGLGLTATMHNVGDHAAPCFFGWHPYFRVSDGKVDEWLLEIPASTLICTDSRMIALPGKAAFLPLDYAPAFDFRRARLIADSVLDTGYVDLEPHPDGRICSRVTNPDDGFSVPCGRSAARPMPSPETPSNTARGQQSQSNRWNAWRTRSIGRNGPTRSASSPVSGECFAAASR
jgi:aldose 1-epimerase